MVRALTNIDEFGKNVKKEEIVERVLKGNPVLTRKLFHHDFVNEISKELEKVEENQLSKSFAGEELKIRDMSDVTQNSKMIKNIHKVMNLVN